MALAYTELFFFSVSTFMLNCIFYTFSYNMQIFSVVSKEGSHNKSLVSASLVEYVQ